MQTNLDARSAAQSTLTAHLTRRESEVLNLLVRGMNNREMGKSLGISARTVEVHRKQIMQKLNVRNVAALMRAYFGKEPATPQPNPRVSVRVSRVNLELTSHGDILLQVEFKPAAIERLLNAARQAGAFDT